MDFVPPDVCLRHRVNLKQSAQHDTDSEFQVLPLGFAILSLTACQDILFTLFCVKVVALVTVKYCLHYIE